MVSSDSSNNKNHHGIAGWEMLGIRRDIPLKRLALSGRLQENDCGMEEIDGVVGRSPEEQMKRRRSG
jgi:hypothetical protein